MALPGSRFYDGGCARKRVMPLYDVPIVRSDFLSLWHEFWDGAEPTERARHADADGSLNRAVKVRAANATQAASIAERDNPDCVAIQDYVRKVQQ
jgi:hypothetical protein